MKSSQHRSNSEIQVRQLDGILIRVGGPKIRARPTRKRPVERGVRESAARLASVAAASAGYIQVTPEALQDQLGAFFEKLKGAMKSIPEAVGSFSVDTIELSLEVTAGGTIGLLGTGAEASATGGITVTLKRKDLS